MIHKKHTIYALAGILLSLNALTQAYFGENPFRRRDVDYNEPAKPAGLLHEERGGVRYFAPLTPVKEIVGAYDYNREDNEPVRSHTRERVYDEDYNEDYD